MGTSPSAYEIIKSKCIAVAYNKGKELYKIGV